MRGEAALGFARVQMPLPLPDCGLGILRLEGYECIIETLVQFRMNNFLCSTLHIFRHLFIFFVQLFLSWNIPCVYIRLLTVNIEATVTEMEQA